MNTILFGNGLNQITISNKSWDSIIACDLGKEISNTLKYEHIYLTKDFKPVENEKAHTYTSEYKLKKEIIKPFFKYASNAIYEQLLQLSVDHFITTNYDHAMYIAYENLGFVHDKAQSNISESIYNIRRKFCFDNRSLGEKRTIWKIHGDIDTPRSVMLGYDHYCGQIAKMNEYVKGTYKGFDFALDPISERIKKEIAILSWIDLFFVSDLHIIGFGLSFDEIDLWWLLNKRIRFKREGKAINNRIHFYDFPIDSNKKKIMEDFGIEVHEYKELREYKDDTEKYTELYQQIIKDIKMYIENN